VMQAERERQDRAWTQPVEEDTGPLVAVAVPVKKKTTQ